MPETSRETLLTTTAEFQLQRNKFEFIAELIRTEASVLQYQVTVKHKRGAEPSSEPWLDDVVIYTTVSSPGQAHNKSKLSQDTRKLLLDLLYYEGLEVWYYRSYISGGEPAEAFRRRFDQDKVYNRAGKIATAIIEEFVDWLETLECPNGEDGCPAIHFYLGAHRETSNGLMVPSELVTRFNYQNEQGETARFLYWIDDDAIISTGRRGMNAPQTAAAFGFGTCGGCMNIHSGSALRTLSIQGGTTSVCNRCEASIIPCGVCEQENWSDQIVETGWFNDEENDYETTDMCPTCRNSHNDNQQLNLLPYSYRPALNFWALTPNNDPLFMGMELEVGREQAGHNSRVNKWIRELDEGLFYVKSDSSIHDGMEVVTHPFTYGWADVNFPFHVFDELLEIPYVHANHSSAGTHIHLSKSAFDVTHMWKFILLFCENHSFFGTLGDRGDTHRYGPLTGPTMRTLRENLLDIVKAGGNANLVGIGLGRDGVNLSNEATIEMRFLAGNIQPRTIKKNMQLMKAAYDFTKEVKASDALKGALADPGYFVGWVEDTDYEELKAHISKSFPLPKKLERIS